MHRKITKHEKSKAHIDAASLYGRWKKGKTIDREAEKVLHRIVAIILTMCSLNLALRGHREVCEGGNFLGLVALMAQYDEILAKVISLPKYVTKYLGHNIQEEIIALLGNTVRKFSCE